MSSLFAGIGNVAVLSPIGDYAIYVNLILAADVYIADCDMAEVCA